MNKQLKKFIKDKTIELLLNGYGVNFVNQAHLKTDGTNFKHSGEFDEDNKTLTVAFKNSQKVWLPVFVHEYAHYVQHINQHKAWVENMPALVEFFTWLENPVGKIKKETVFKTQLLELDCEKTAVKIIQEYNLPIDVEHYIQAANCYILSYNLFYKYKSWSVDSIYKHPNTYESLPTKFMPQNWYRKTPKNFAAKTKKLFRK